MIYNMDEQVAQNLKSFNCLKGTVNNIFFVHVYL